MSDHRSIDTLCGRAHPSRVSRRQFVKAGGSAAAAVGAAALIGRSAAARPSFQPSLKQDLAAAELTFYFGANPVEAETRQKVIDAFTAKYPQITIKPQVAEGDPIQELQVQFAGGSGPDIMMAWELSYSGLAEREIYADLNQFIQADPEFAAVVQNDHIPELLQMFQWNGAQQVLPEQYAGVVLYYNKKLFAEAGIAPPPADWTDTSWTYQKFLETAQALTKKDGSRVTQFGFADAWWPPLSAAVWATGNGGNWFDAYVNPEASTITDPKFTEGVQFFADLVNVHGVAPNAEQSQTQSGADRFIAGQVAMCLVGHWFYPAFSTTEGLEFDIGVFPLGPGGTTPKTDLGSTGLSVSASTEYPEHAWEFVKFSTGPEGQKIIAESGLFVPVLKSVGASESFTGAHSKIENTQVFTEALTNSVPLPITPVWNEIVAVWERETTKILRGEAKAADVHAAIEPQITGLLQRG